MFNKNMTYLLKRTMLRAAKVSLIYLFIGILLIALADIDYLFPLRPFTRWQNLFEITDKIGTIFLAVALVRFIYKLIVLLCRHYEKKLLEKHSVASLLLSSARKGLRIIYILVVINIIISLFGPSKLYLIFANNVINTIIIMSIGWITVQILYTFEAVVYQNVIKLEKKDYRRAKALYTKTHILRNVATVVIILITLAAVLMSFSSVRNIGISLLASAGFLTAIIGLSAQKTLVSLFSGLQIAFAQPIKIGDMVVVENESGIIEEITFTYVTLKLGDRRRLFIPINYFIEKPFENWSHESDSMRSSIHFHVDYMMPIEPVRNELNRILSQSDLWDGVASQLQVAELNDKTVKIRMQVSATNADKLFDLIAEVREKMLTFFQKHYPNYFPVVRSISEDNKNSA